MLIRCYIQVIILKINIEQLIDIIKSNNEFELYTHMKPDGDAVASAFGLAVTLQSMGKKATVKCCDTFPEKYNFLIADFKDDAVNNPVLLATDISGIERLGAYANEKITVCIDHHSSNKCLIENTYLEGDAVSCSLIIYKVFKHMHTEIPKKALELLFMGIITDSMCFQSPATNSDAFKIAAEIASKIDAYKIMNKAFISKSKNELFAEQNLISNLKYCFDDKLVIGYLDNEIMNQIGNIETDSLASVVMKPYGVQLGVVIIEKFEENFGISIRSNGSVDASLLAAALGGGGHKAAAGALIEALNINKAVELIAATAKKIYNYQ